MSRGVAFIVLLALVAAANAAGKWYIEEEWSYGTGCSEKKMNDLKAYTATRSGVCYKQGNFYYKYTCSDNDAATTAAYVGRCDNSDCTNCTDTSDMNLATCVSKPSSFKVASYRCSTSFPEGQDGLSTIIYSDDACAESYKRTFAFANTYCASSSSASGNYSHRLECGSEIKEYKCDNSLTCEGCGVNTYAPNTCIVGRKFVCGSGTAGAATIVISVAFVVFAAVTALVSMI